MASLSTSSIVFMLYDPDQGLKEYYAAAGGFRSLILVVIKRLLKVSKNVLGINFG